MTSCVYWNEMRHMPHSCHFDVHKIQCIWLNCDLCMMLGIVVGTIRNATKSLCVDVQVDVGEWWSVGRLGQCDTYGKLCSVVNLGMRLTTIKSIWLCHVQKLTAQNKRSWAIPWTGAQINAQYIPVTTTAYYSVLCNSWNHLVIPAWHWNDKANIQIWKSLNVFPLKVAILTTLYYSVFI